MLSAQHLRYKLIRFAVVAVLGLHLKSALAQIYSDETQQIIPGTQGITPGPGIDLSNWNTTGHTLEYATIQYTDLTGASFENTVLASSDLQGTAFVNVDFSNATLSGSELSFANITGANLTGAAIDGVDFDYAKGFTVAQFYSTATYQGTMISGGFEGINLAGCNFANKDVSAADFGGSDLTNANFTGAILTHIHRDPASGNSYTFGTSFGGYNLTAAQLYSTASYQAGNLTSVGLGSEDFSGINFANINLSHCGFYGVNLTNANLTGANCFEASFPQANLSDADLRGALNWTPDPSANTHDTILPNGTMNGLAMNPGELLTLRQDPVALNIIGSATFDTASTLQFLLAKSWLAAMGFAAGNIPSLAGNLDLEFASDVTPAALVGNVFHLFNWNNILPAGDQFDSITTTPGFVWDTSQLYIYGTVTLIAVPEPISASIVIIAAVARLASRRR